MRLSSLCFLSVPLLCAVGCGKIEIAYWGGNPDLSSSNNGNLDGGVQDSGGQQFDLIGQPIAMAKATPVDQPSGAGAPVYPPVAGIGVFLSAAGSNDPKGQTLSYAWKVTAVPSGSTVADANVTNNLTDKATFTPDLGGDYQFELTVTTTDSRSVKANLTVSVQTAPIFYKALEIGDLQFGRSQRMIRSDGTGLREIGCPFNAPYTSGESSAFGVEMYGAGLHTRTYYPPADTTTGLIGPAKFVYSVGEVDTDLGNGLRWGLRLGAEDSDCASKLPVTLPRVLEGIQSQPRFSPAGDRLVYNLMIGDKTDAATVLGTVTGEGAQLTGVSPGTPYLVHPTTPAWLDASTLLIAGMDQTTDPIQPKVRFYRAKLNGSTVMDFGLYADCSTAVSWFGIERIEALPDGGFIVSARGNGGGSDLPQFGFDLYKVAAPAPSTTNCSVTALTTASSDTFGAARDWELSPDGKQIVYARIEPEIATLPGDLGRFNGVGSSDIWILDINAPAGAKKIAGDSGFTDFGPHFINNGRQITWTQGPPASVFGNLPDDFGGVSATYKGISIVNVDGTNAHSLVAGSADFVSNGPPTIMSTPFGGTGWTVWGCNVDPLAHPLSSVLMGFLVAGAIALGARRRRS